MSVMQHALRAPLAGLVALSLAMSTVPAPAHAGFWDWYETVTDWFGGTEEAAEPDPWARPSDPMVLVSQRSTLANQESEAQVVLADTVTELRNNGADETEVARFLDEAELRYAELTDDASVASYTLAAYAAAPAGAAICAAGPAACAALVAAAALAAVIASSDQISQALRTTLVWVASKLSYNPVAETMTPPGDCPPDQHRDLQNRVENACRSLPACRSGQSIDVLKATVKRHSACIDARTRIDSTCFKGGDRGHRQQIQDRTNSIQNCLGLM